MKRPKPRNIVICVALLALTFAIFAIIPDPGRTNELPGIIRMFLFPIGIGASIGSLFGRFWYGVLWGLVPFAVLLLLALIGLVGILINGRSGIL